MKKVYWSKGEIERLHDLVQKSTKLTELKKIYKEYFPDRTWSSVEHQIRRTYKVDKGKVVFGNSDDSVDIEKEQEQQEQKSVFIGFITDKELDLIKRLARGSMSFEEVAEFLDIPKSDVLEVINKLRSAGYDVVVEEDLVVLKRAPEEGKTIVLPRIENEVVRFMIVSDTALGLKQSQPTLLYTAYALAKREGVRFVLHAGNLTAGKPTAKTSQDFFIEKFEDQRDYVIEKYPRGLKTYIIAGPRDLTWKTAKGRNIVRAICEERDDLRYAGDLEEMFDIAGIKVAVLHVKNDNSTYTKSYSLQGIVENFEEALNYIKKKERPDIVLLGGTAVHLYAPRNNGRQPVALPSLCGMTTSQRTRKKRSGGHSLGIVIVTINKKTKEVTFDFRDWTAYQRENDYLEPGPEIDGLDDEEKKILKVLREPAGLGRLSREIKRSKKHVKTVIEQLIQKGYNIVYDQANKRFSLLTGWKNREFRPLSVDMFLKEKIKLAVFSDTHIGNKAARVELISKVYKIAEEEKVQKVLHCGDVFDGDGAYPGQSNDLAIHGADAQREFGQKIWPKSKIPTEIIRGSSHELVFWQKSGHDIVRVFAEFLKLKRKNKMNYLGGLSGISHIGKIWYKLLHPKGGIPYGISYRVQRIIEALVSTINKNNDRIHALFVGHLHQSLFMIYKGIAGFLVPCLEGQTEYLEGKGLIPSIGMWIVEIEIDTKGNVTRVVPKHIKLGDP